MSILYSNEDGYFISHKLFISKLYEKNMDKTENTEKFYEHFFHIRNPFIKDKQQVITDAENESVKRKRKRPKYEVNITMSSPS